MTWLSRCRNCRSSMQQPWLTAHRLLLMPRQRWLRRKPKQLFKKPRKQQNWMPSTQKQPRLMLSNKMSLLAYSSKQIVSVKKLWLQHARLTFSQQRSTKKRQLAWWSKSASLLFWLSTLKRWPGLHQPLRRHQQRSLALLLQDAPLLASNRRPRTSYLSGLLSTCA